MRIGMLAVGMATLLLAGEARATEIGSSRPFGLGIVLGDPSGISGKYYVGGRRNAIDFAVGSWYDGGFYNDIYVHVAYHWHFEELASGGGVAIPLRIGVGGFIGSGYHDPWFDDRWYHDDFVLGARVPFGIDFDLEGAPVQFFLEISAAVPVVPFVGVGLDAGAGVRYYF